MKNTISQEQINDTAVRLGIPTIPFFQRRIARAHDLVETNKVNEISHDDGLYRVHSQHDDKIYTVEVNHGNPAVTRLAKGKACAPRCSCPDGKKTVHCKHMIASMMTAFEQEPKLTVKETPNPKVKASWVVVEDGRTYVNVWQDLNGKICCVCGAYYKRDCIHKQAIRDYYDGAHRRSLSASPCVSSNGSKVVNECGTSEAKSLQDKLNGNNGTGGESHPSTQLDVNDPFQESELLDIDQIEGRSWRVPRWREDMSSRIIASHALGDLVHKLSNGEYVISYNGIMALAEQHNVTFTKHTVKSDAKRNGTVIAHARRGNNTRASGKPMNGSFITAVELAKRNAARQLLPLVEIKALEKKAQLEAEFDWQVAKRKCLELVPEANLNCIINDLVNDGKLEQKHPSDYGRKEWLVIFDAVKNDNNGGGDKTRHHDNFAECRDAAKHFVRYSWLKADMLRGRRSLFRGRFRRSSITPRANRTALKEGVVSDDWTGACGSHQCDAMINHRGTRDDIAKLKEACEIDASLFGKELGHWTVEIQPNHGKWAYQRRWSFWLTPMSRRCFWCARGDIVTENPAMTEGVMPDTFIKWGRYEIKASLCLECSRKVGSGELDKEALTKKFDELYHAYGGVGGKNTVITKESIYGGRKVKAEIDTNRPHWVTLRYDNGKTMQVYDKLHYDIVLQSA